MIDYLFYKLFRAFQRSSVPEAAGLLANGFLTLLVFLNVFCTWALLKKAEILHVNLFPDKKSISLFMGGVFVFLALIFFVRSRYEKIIARFEKEGNNKRIRGNIMVLIYVVITFIIALIGPLFKPGVI